MTRVQVETAFGDVRMLEGDGHTGSSGGHVVEVTLIAAGTSRNGNHYPDAVLAAAVPLFEGARAFADHQGLHERPERSVRDLVGYYRNVRYEQVPSSEFRVPGPASPNRAPGTRNQELGTGHGRVRAELHVIPGQEWLWALVQEQAANPDVAILGLSIDGNGSISEATIDGRTVRRVDELTAISSVDVVTRPSAGGKFDRILCSEIGGLSSENVPHGSSQNWSEATLSAEERRRYATVIHHHGTHTEYMFPIPPKGHPEAESHAGQALRMLNASDLTDEEKASVRLTAEAVLGKQENGTKERKGAQPVSNNTDDTSGVQEARDGTVSSESSVRGGVSHTPSEGPPRTPSQNSESRASGTPGVGPQNSILETVAQLQAERDAAAAELRKLQEMLNPAGATGTNPSGARGSPADQALTLLEQIKRERDTERCTRLLEETLRATALPAPVLDRLRRRYAGRTFSVQTLEADIAEEREVLGKLTDTGVVRGHNYEKPITVGMSEYEQLQAAFDGLFDVYESDAARSVPRLGGIREAFRIATGIDIASIGGADRPLREAFATGLRNYVVANRDRLVEAEYLLREADVTTSSFSYLLGTSMNKRLLKDYQAWPSEWQKFVSLVAVKDFKQQDRIRLGAFGSLSTVSEDAAYTTLTLSDTRATYTPTKRGNLVQISRETIINDDLYAIKQIPQKLAVAAAFTLAEFVYEFLDPAAGNIYDSHKLFDSVNHTNSAVATANLGTANSGGGLTTANMQTGVINMRKQQNMASKPIGLKPRYLLVPPDLEFTAMNILKSAGLPGGSNNDINPMMGYCEPIVSPQLNSFTNLASTTTFWCLVADPRVIDTIEIGFVGGQVNPVLFIQDQPLYGLNFTQDAISYKVRHEYGGAAVDYRGFYLGNN